MRNKKVLLVTVNCKDCKSILSIPFNESTKVGTLIAEMAVHSSHNAEIKRCIFERGVIDRPMFVWMENEYYISIKKLVGIEIGVHSGENAKKILTTLNVEKLYLIDPYSPYSEDGKSIDYTNVEELMKKNLMSYSKFIEFIKDTSENAASKIKDDSVDFVYLDGNHSYEYIKKDLELYYPKLKSRGIMGGHDFTPETFGVAKAVIEFVEKNNIKPLMAKKHSSERDWWFIKP